MGRFCCVENVLTPRDYVVAQGFIEQVRTSVSCLRVDVLKGGNQWN